MIIDGGVDTGFGITKGVVEDAFGQRKSVMFPSCIEPYSPSSLEDFKGDKERGRREVFPVVNDVRYRVVIDETPIPNVKRPAPVDGFQATDHYTALTAAMLHALGVSELDVLVMGAPNHTFQRYRAELQERFTGLHDHGLGPVKIREVRVYPQPFGCLLFAQDAGEVSADPTISNLVIDAGYYTLDTLAATGVQVDSHRSHGVPFGTHAILKKIAEQMQKEVGAGVARLDRIDFALRTGKTLAVHDHNVDVRKYLPQVEPWVLDAVNELKVKVGSHEDARVILTGGGAHLFLPAVKKAFPRNRIHVMADPVYANAEGFLIAARAASQRHWRNGDLT